MLAQSPDVGRPLPAVTIENLAKSYGSRRVVEGLNLTVAAGEIVALTGANGAGKTTTVECLEGFRRPDTGRVRVLDCDPHRDRDRLMPHLGVMLQEGGVYQSATPREMLRLFARFYPFPADPAALLGLLDLDGVAGVRFRALSGGQKQRLSLALALVGNPSVAILDEPTAGMDPHGRRRVWDLLRHRREGGLTILLTTHALDEAEALADRVAVIDRGRLLACDSPAALTHAWSPDTGRLEDAYLRLTGAAG
jgi:ABC-2 type transport system ATP-binding protein